MWPNVRVNLARKSASNFHENLHSDGISQTGIHISVAANLTWDAPIPHYFVLFLFTLAWAQLLWKTVYKAFLSTRASCDMHRLGSSLWKTILQHFTAWCGFLNLCFLLAALAASKWIKRQITEACPRVITAFLKKLTFILLQLLHLQLVRFTLDIQLHVPCYSLKYSSPFICFPSLAELVFSILSLTHKKITFHFFITFILTHHPLLISWTILFYFYYYYKSTTFKSV